MLLSLRKPTYNAADQLITAGIYESSARIAFLPSTTVLLHEGHNARFQRAHFIASYNASAWTVDSHDVLVKELTIAAALLTGTPVTADGQCALSIAQLYTKLDRREKEIRIRPGAFRNEPAIIADVKQVIANCGLLTQPKGHHDH